jgi:hypothetical protein
MAKQGTKKPPVVCGEGPRVYRIVWGSGEEEPETEDLLGCFELVRSRPDAKPGTQIVRKDGVLLAKWVANKFGKEGS